MLMKLKTNGHLVNIANLEDLVNPFRKTVVARSQWGEEEQDPERVAKDDLCFASGECLPRCWHDEQYRDDEVAAHKPGSGK